MNFIAVPYISIKLANGKEVWMDAYFSKNLEERFRVASLIRPSESIELEFDDIYVLKPILEDSEIKSFVSEILKEVDARLGDIRASRGRYYAMWSLLRVLFIPFGWSKKIREDEMKSSLERELIQSKRILEKVESLTPGRSGFFKLEVVNRKPADVVYKKLYEIDSGFRKSFDEVVDKIR